MLLHHRHYDCQPHRRIFLLGTYKTPMLMAITTPIFSFLLICNSQINFHGRKASAISITAEYTDFVSSG